MLHLHRRDHRWTAPSSTRRSPSSTASRDVGGTSPRSSASGPATCGPRTAPASTRYATPSRSVTPTARSTRPADEPARGGRPGRLDDRAADGLPEEVGPPSANLGSASPRSAGRAGTLDPRRRQRVLSAVDRTGRLRLPRPSLQPAPLLHQLPRLGDPDPLGRAGALRGRLQACRLQGHRHAKRVQLEGDHAARARGASSRASRRRSSSCRATTSPGWAATTSSRCARAADTSSCSSSTRSVTWVPRSASTTSSGRKVGRVSHLRNVERLAVCGPRSAVLSAVEACRRDSAGERCEGVVRAERRQGRGDDDELDGRARARRVRRERRRDGRGADDRHGRRRHARLALGDRGNCRRRRRARRRWSSPSASRSPGWCRSTSCGW